MNTHHVFDKEYSNVIDAQSQYVAGYYSPDSLEDPNAADSSDSEDDTENKTLSPRGITPDSTLDDVLAAYGDSYTEYTFGNDGRTVEIHHFSRQDNGEYIDTDDYDNEEDSPYEGYEPSTYYYEMSDDNRKITVYMENHYDSGDDVFAYKEFEYFPEYRTFGVNYNMNGLYGLHFPVED